MKVAVTGHRPDKLGKEYDMKGPISKKIYQALDETIQTLKSKQIISGMALGVDMIFANLAINRGIPFIAAIPFEKSSLPTEVDKNWVNDLLLVIRAI